MTDGQTTSRTGRSGSAGLPPWHRPAKDAFDTPGDRPARPRTDLPQPSANRMGQPLKLRRRGRKAGDVPLRLEPERTGPPPWMRTAPRPEPGEKGRSTKRPRGRLTGREMMSRETGAKWIGPVSSDPEGPSLNPLLALEARLFPTIETSGSSWRRKAVTPPGAKRTARIVRPVGELEGRPQPRKRRLPWHRRKTALMRKRLETASGRTGQEH